MTARRTGGCAVSILPIKTFLKKDAKNSIRQDCGDLARGIIPCNSRTFSTFNLKQMSKQKQTEQLPQAHSVARVLPGDAENLKWLLDNIAPNDYIFAFSPDQNVSLLIQRMI